MQRSHVLLVGFVALISAVLIACGGGDDSSSSAGGSSSGGSAGGSAASAGSAGGGTDAGSATGSMTAKAQQMTADGKSCVDLVKAKRYADAIAPCDRAMKEAANTNSAEVQQAYDETKQYAADQARAAATQAAADSMAGKDPGDAAKDAASNALKGFGN